MLLSHWLLNRHPTRRFLPVNDLQFFYARSALNDNGLFELSLSLRLSVRPSVRLSVCLSVCCLFVLSEL